jgi:hypothetical protein
MLRIQYAMQSGGKAGRGLNKTSTIQIRDEINCIVKQFQYVVNDSESERKAFRRAKKYIKQKGNN